MELLNLKLDRLILLKTSEKTDRGEIVALARSIAKHGVLVPITVKQILYTDRYEIISGTKRFYACRLARLKTVPAFVVDAQSALTRLIIKKNEKQDCFEEAEAMRSVILNENLSIEEASDLTGYTEKQILSLLRLTKLGEFEKELVRRNNVNKEIASEIATFDDICKRTELLSEAIRSRLKPAEVATMCERERQGRRRLYQKANKTPKFRDIRLFDNTISRAITLLKEAGVKASVMTEQANGGTEYKIRIEH